MSVFLKWVDSSDHERELMQRTIALFQEQDTRDELGLGTIRDVFAASMFPGTSTIQTRLRYFLFIPWIYRALESKRISVDRIAARARREELALIETLLDSDDTRGVIGKRSRGALKRLPSSVYWAGLLRWGICRYDGSLDQYHRSFDRLRQMRRARHVPEDEGVELDPLHTWDPQLPHAPDEWPEETSFELTLEEARYVADRIASQCRDSALAWLAYEGRSTDVAAVWLHPQLGEMPAALQTEIDLARRFSLVMHGAALLYNAMLAELGEMADYAEHYRDVLSRWASQEERDDLQRFDVSELWRYVHERGGRVPGGTRQFIERWVSLLSAHDPARIVDFDGARALVRGRERSIKGPRSRFANRRALDQWGGSSGAGRLTYRWPTAQTLLNDLFVPGEQ